MVLSTRLRQTKGVWQCCYCKKKVTVDIFGRPEKGFCKKSPETEPEIQLHKWVIQETY